MSSLRVPWAPTSAALVRHELAADLETHVAPEALEAAVLIVSELVGNAVRHGRALPGDELLACWTLVGRELRVQVVDGGTGPTASQGHLPLREPTTRPGPAQAEGGRGLELVEALSARWGSRPWPDAPAPAGTAVWAELPADGPPLA